MFNCEYRNYKKYSYIIQLFLDVVSYYAIYLMINFSSIVLNILFSFYVTKQSFIYIFSI